MYIAPKYRDLFWFAGMAVLIGLFLAVAYVAALGWTHWVGDESPEPDRIIVELEPYGGCDEAYLYPDTEGGRMCGWRPVDTGLADALAEGEQPDATTRHWERCFTNDFYVVCPDGLRLSLQP